MTWTYKLMLTYRFWLPSLTWTKKMSWGEEEEVKFFEELTMLAPVWTHCVPVKFGTFVRRHTTERINKRLNKIKR